MERNKIAVFLSRVKNNDSGCWIWTGATKEGYGLFSFGIKTYPVKAHRFSYEVHKGPIPKGLNILHNCHNRKCVNPDHLRAGTQKDNVADDLKRGIHISSNPNARWKETIFNGKTYPSRAIAAKENGLSKDAIYSQVKKGKIK